MLTRSLLISCHNIMHLAINFSNIYIDLDEAEKIYEQHDLFFVHGTESLVIDCCRYYIHEKIENNMTNLKFNVEK